MMQTNLQQTPQMDTKTGIALALAKFDGSPTRLAAAVGNGVLRQHVEHWSKTGRVSAEKAPDVALASGIPVDQLCPGVNWQAVRNSAPVQQAA